MNRITICLAVLLPLSIPLWAAQTEALASPDSRQDWYRNYDLDGDGTNDVILAKFSGGGHCCYEIGATLTSTKRTIMLPFWMDGGYPFGLTLQGRPNHFTIRTREGQLPEILMEISTYNGEPEPLPREWKKRYRIKTHRIGISFPNGKVRVRDVSDWPYDRQPWQMHYDLDGDGKNDEILVTFTGGTYCCFKIGATLTSTRKTHLLPFWMDGSQYQLGSGGMTLLDQPDHFTIRTTEGQLPEILMEIADIWEIKPLPREWTERYRIVSNRIGISFPNGTVRVRDAYDWPSRFQ